MKEKISIKENISNLVVILFLTSTICVFAPSLVYLNNRGEFDITYIDLLSVVIPVSIFFIIAIALFVSFISLNPNLYRKLLSVVFCAAILLWLQGNILLWNYGPLDGRDIHWNGHIYKGLIDTCIWFAILMFAFLKSSLTYKIARKASWIFILLQLTASLYFFYQNPGTDIPSFKRYHIDESTKFLFSKNKNVILLVLDSFQTDIFQEIIKEDLEYKKIFSGFTYFRDALAGHPHTETSISLTLTGKYYEGLYPFEQHNKIAYSGKSVPRVLKTNGFRVELYPYVNRAIYFDKTIESNIIRTKILPDDIQREISYLYDISMFRFLPHFTKNYIYNNQNWLIKRHPEILSLFIPKGHSKKTETKEGKDTPWLSIFKDNNLRKNRDIIFINSMLHLALANETIPIFKYYHLVLPHWPLIINEKLKYEKMAINRQNYKRQAKAALKITEMFLNKLREIGVYDQSLIIILGDHGAGAQNQVFKKQDGFYMPRNSQIVSNPHQINALSLVLVKSFNSKGKMNSSNAPVSLSDIPKTIFSELGIEIEAPGENMLKVNESNSRTRKFIDYAKFDSKSDYYAGLMEFLVSGPGWVRQSWKMTPRVFHHLGMNIQMYKYGEFISFGNRGNALQYQKKGWSPPEEGFTWSLGERAELELPVKHSNSNLTLTADIFPFLVSGKINSQRVKLYINDRSVGEWNVDRSGQYKVEIPQSYLIDDSIRIVFELPDAASPTVVGIGDDLRPLAISLKKLAISEK